MGRSFARSIRLGAANTGASWYWNDGMFPLTHSGSRLRGDLGRRMAVGAAGKARLRH